MNARETRGLAYAAFYGAIFGVFAALVLGAMRGGIATVGADYPGTYWLSGAVAGAVVGLLVRAVARRFPR